MPLRVLVGGQEVVAPAETAARANAMQTREPAQKSEQISACAMAMEANNGKKTGGADAPLVPSCPHAACTAVDDAGLAQQRSGGAGDEGRRGNGELYFFLIFSQILI